MFRARHLACATFSILAFVCGSLGDASAEPKGIHATLSVVIDSLADVSGGARRGLVPLDKADLGVNIDAGAWGLDGFGAFVDVQQASGGGLSARFVGDAQGVSNIDGIPGFSLYQAWVERAWGDDAAVKAGIIDLNSEFDLQEIGTVFVNSSFGIGPEFAQSGDMGPSIFPATGIGARLSSAIGDVRFKLGVFDAVPRDLIHRHLPDVTLSSALLAGEAQWNIAKAHVKLGGWLYTSKLPDLNSVAGTRYGNHGLYASVSARLYQEPGDNGAALDGWVRAGTSRATFNPISTYVGGGLVYTGPIPGRSSDQLGLGVASAIFGTQTRLANLPPLAAAETAIELTYAAPVTGWLLVQPDIQYVIAPGGDTQIGDALVAGVRLSMSLAPSDAD